MKSQIKALKYLCTVLVIFSIQSFLIPLSAQSVLTTIYTDYNNFWFSSTTDTSLIRPDKSHNLLGFAWNGNTYSTGVNDARLTQQGISFSPASFRAFPISNLTTGGASNYVALGQLYDGVNNGFASPAPFITPANGRVAASFLTDGIRGLDLGTGIANIPVGALTFNLSSVGIDVNAIGDGVPDVVVTQIAQPATDLSKLDKIYFVDANNAVVGTTLTINHNTTGAVVGSWLPDFYTLAGTGQIVNSRRSLILWGAELTSFGITTLNASSAVALKYELSGESDVAFLAYNVPSISMATQLGITAQPNSTLVPACCNNISGSAFSQFPVVQIQDAAAHDIPQAGTSVTATIASGPAGYSALSGTTVVTTNTSGQAIFNNLILPCTPGDYTITFSSSILEFTTSNTVTVSKLFYYPLAGNNNNLSALNSWRNNPDGTGTAPTDFGAGKEFILNNTANETSFSTGGNWTLTGQLTIPAGKTLTINSGTTATLSCDINQAGIVSGAAGSSMVLNGTRTQSLAGTNQLKNLVINNTAGVVLGNNLAIENALTLTSGVFDIGNHSLTLGSTISRTTGTINAAATSGLVVFAGSTAQVIPANTFSGNINSLTINNAAGVTANSNMIVNNMLSLNSGTLTIGNNSLTAADITGGSTSSFVRTNGTGKLQMNLLNSATRMLPVGFNSYNPVTITNNSGTTDLFGARVLNEVYSNGTSGTPLTGPRIRATWDIIKTLPNAGSGVNMNFAWQAAQNNNVAIPLLNNYHDANWEWQSNAGTSTPTPTSYTYNNYLGTISAFYINDENYVLPLTWKRFDVKKQKEKVILTWATMSESNTKDFLVLHKVEGMDWTTIGKLPALTAISLVREYSFTHANPLDGINYYQIRQNDLDGKFSHSNIMNISMENQPGQTFIVSNPVTNGLMMLKLDELSLVTMFDANGKLAWKQTRAKGSHQIDVRPLATGMYLLKIGEKKAIRVIVEKK